MSTSGYGPHHDHEHGTPVDGEHAKWALYDGDGNRLIGNKSRADAWDDIIMNGFRGYPDTYAEDENHVARIDNAAVAGQPWPESCGFGAAPGSDEGYAAP